MERIFVLLGEDVEFGTEVVKAVLKNNKVQVSGLLGVSAFDVRANIKSSHPGLTSDIQLVSERKPWETPKFWRIVNTSSLGINGGIQVRVPAEVNEMCKIVNLHPSYLPFNKGSHHAFWSIMNDTPKGGSIHWMNNQMDAGPIIARREIQDDGFLTSEQIQKMSLQICLDLLQEKLTDILEHKADVINNEPGNLHLKSEIKQASTLFENELYTGKYIWNLIRATRNGSHGFWISSNNREFHIVAKITEKE